MTEAEWSNCSDPLPMLDFLAGRVSDRKLRLFAVACCWRVADCLWTVNSPRAVQVAERYADQRAELVELDQARSLVENSLELYPDEPVYDASYWACGREIEDVWICAQYAVNCCVRRIKNSDNPDFDAQCDERANVERREQARIVRDLFGNPLRVPAVVDPTVRTWNAGTVVLIAAGIYADHAYGRLPILHDVLLDAGCDNEDILAHCRSAGPHVRGCWVIDLILGKS